MGRKPIPPGIKVCKLPESVKKPASAQFPQKPLNYWERPAYKHLAFLKRVAEQAGNAAEIQRVANLMQQAMNGKLPSDLAEKLSSDYKEHRKEVSVKESERRREQRMEEKKGGKIGVNVSKLTQRIWNPQTSLENVIAAFEALPRQDKERLVQNISPFLKRRLGAYLKKKGYMA
ncbi:MAG: hypothetical protein WC602_03960 [archaeon]